MSESLGVVSLSRDGIRSKAQNSCVERNEDVID